MLWHQEERKPWNLSKSLHIPVTSFALVPSSWLGTGSVDSAQQRNVTEGAQFLQHKLFVSVCQSPLWRCCFCWELPDVAKPIFNGQGRWIPGEPSSLSMCGCTKDKVASNPGTNGSPATGTSGESPGTQAVSGVSFPHSETFRPRNSPCPSLSRSLWDAAHLTWHSTYSVCSSSWFYLKFQQLEEQLWSWPEWFSLFQLKLWSLRMIKEWFYPISGAFGWV